MFFWEVLGVTGLDDGERRRTFPVSLHLRGVLCQRNEVLAGESGQRSCLAIQRNVEFFSLQCLGQPLVLEGRGSNIGEVVVTGRSSRAVGA
jgi:hypothetical protein